MSLDGYIVAKNVSNFHEDIVSKTPPNWEHSFSKFTAAFGQIVQTKNIKWPSLIIIKKNNFHITIFLQQQQKLKLLLMRKTFE